MPVDVDFNARVEQLVENFFRDIVYRAPESRAEWRARLIADLQQVVDQALNEGAMLGMLGARPDTDIVHVARCPEHGLHGQRTVCFVCGGPVEQVPMIELGDRP